jgi:hypothetical protein
MSSQITGCFGDSITGGPFPPPAGYVWGMFAATVAQIKATQWNPCVMSGGFQYCLGQSGPLTGYLRVGYGAVYALMRPAAGPSQPSAPNTAYRGVRLQTRTLAGGECDDPTIDPRVDAALQYRLSQSTCPRCGPLGARPMQPNVLHSLGLLPRPRPKAWKGGGQLGNIVPGHPVVAPPVYRPRIGPVFPVGPVLPPAANASSNGWTAIPTSQVPAQAQQSITTFTNYWTSFPPNPGSMVPPPYTSGQNVYGPLTYNGVTYAAVATSTGSASTGYSSSFQWYTYTSWFLGWSRQAPLGSLGAAQSVTVVPGSVSVSAQLGDSISIGLPIGASGSLEGNWVPPGSTVYSFPAGIGTITGGTPGGTDPISIVGVTASGVGTVNWVDATGTNQTTNITISVAGAPAQPPNSTATATSTGTIIGIGAAAILAGGLLAYGLSRRHAGAVEPAPMNTRRAHPKNVRRR